MTKIIFIALVLGQSGDCTMTVYASQKRLARPGQTHTWAVFTSPSGAKVVINWNAAERVRPRQMRGVLKGVNLTHEQSMQNARGRVVLKLGPYKIKKGLFDLAKKQEALLNSGKVFYTFLDRGVRPLSFNCMHAVADIDVSRGRLMTGAASGFDGAAMIVNHLKGWIIP